MDDIKILIEYFRQDKKGAVAVLLAALIGAGLGVTAYYQGWLG